MRNSGVLWGMLAFAVSTQDLLGGWAASEVDILQAPCRQSKVKSDAEIQDYLKSVLSPEEKPETRQFLGLELTGDPRLLKAIEALLTNQTAGLFEKSLPQNKFSSACKTPDCVLNSSNFFSAKTGWRLLYLYFNFGILASKYTLPRGEAWKTEELDEIEKTLNDYPSSIFPIEPARPLVRFQPGYSIAFGNSDDQGFVLFGNASIYLFDPWVEAASPTKQIALFHELGHVFDWNWWSSRPEWLQLSDWPLDPKLWKDFKMDPNKFVSEYSRSNPAEDFAESVVAYRYRPENFERRAPRKYAFIRDGVFMGVEYKDETTCKGKWTYADRARFWLQANLSHVLRPESVDVRMGLMKFCGERILRDLDPLKYKNLAAKDLALCTSQGLGGLAIQESKVIPESSPVLNAKEVIIEKMKHIDLSASEQITVQNILRGEITNVLSQYLVATTDYGRTDFYFGTDISKVCEAYSKYAYQAAERIHFSKAFGSLNDLFVFYHQRSLNELARAFCLFSQRGSQKPDEKKLNREMVSNYLNSIGLRSDSDNVEIGSSPR